jgi:hypothetical protein
MLPRTSSEQGRSRQLTSIKVNTSANYQRVWEGSVFFLLFETESQLIGRRGATPWR